VIKGLKSHRARLKALQSPATINLVGKAVFAAAQLIENASAISITTGAVSGKQHVASKPGEAPNADTHVLDRSHETIKTGPLTARVQVTAPYAAPLEFGSSKVAARPFLKPARDKKTGEARALVVKAINIALKRARGDGS
jgi:HK97 gp10 family phage protein